MIRLPLGRDEMGVRGEPLLARAPQFYRKRATATHLAARAFHASRRTRVPVSRNPAGAKPSNGARLARAGPLCGVGAWQCGEIAPASPSRRGMFYLSNPINPMPEVTFGGAFV
jgi:hypothetical protein